MADIEIKADLSSIESVQNEFMTTGEEFKKNKEQLLKVMDEIKAGNIKGPAADEILQEYESHKALFEDAEDAINTCQSYCGQKGNALQDTNESATSAIRKNASTNAN